MDGQYQVYEDMCVRTNGEMFIGVVGPVRTGKSTFIKRFMDLLVIPNMKDVHEKERAIDELPQSANGKTIMTTEPKFIPMDAAKIKLWEDIEVAVRLIDCVGYMVDGATGHLENEQERMVKTPWSKEEIPFSKAAEIGTQKVISEHSTIGVVVTTDGSFGELPRETYLYAEERAIKELKEIGKPFVVVMNSSRPYSEDTKVLCQEMEKNYQTKVLAMNCEQLKKEDVVSLLQGILSVFPVTEMQFLVPRWVGVLDMSHPLKQELLRLLKEIIASVDQMKDVSQQVLTLDQLYVKQLKLEEIDMKTGLVKIQVDIQDTYYYETIQQLTGIAITNEKELLAFLKEVAQKRQEYDKMSMASLQVQQKGYGVFTPSVEEIRVDEPQLFKHGNSYGVKIRAVAPSIHLIQANVETEIAPIVGSEEQAQDLIAYIGKQGKEEKDGIWGTNIFGKSLRQLIEEGIQSKVSKLTDESQLKLQDTLQKVVNDSNGGLVCIIL